jgi:hypothetical protein
MAFGLDPTLIILAKIISCLPPKKGRLIRGRFPLGKELFLSESRETTGGFYGA